MAKRLRKDDKVELLSRLALFENCSKRELGELADIFVDAERPEGAYLTREGKDGGLLFLLVEGQAEVLSAPEAEEPRVIGHLGPGDVIGELSLIDGHARSASVRAVSPVHVLQMNSDDFRQVIQGSPNFVRNLLRALSLRVREAETLSI